MDKSKILEDISLFLLDGEKEEAKAFLNKHYPHEPKKIDKRSYSLKEKIKQFFCDGFIDRYTGARLVNPGILKVITNYFPEDFPYDSHWKMTETHTAYWDLIPTIDHIVPIAQGGFDEPGNWATTSMKNNSIKSNYSLQEIGWKLFPRGNILEWDGLTNLFVELVEKNVDLLKDSYIRSWYKASLEIKKLSEKNSVLSFASRWMDKFSDENINYEDLVGESLADDCELLGFKMDSGKSFSELYGKAVYDSVELEKIIRKIKDIALLGTAIYSRWRYFNHWAYDAASILEERNRKWFLLALGRLKHLSG